MSRPRAPRHLPHPNIASPHSLHTAFDATIYPFDSTNNNNQIMTVRFLARLLTVASHNCCSKYSSDASRTVSQKQKTLLPRSTPNAQGTPLQSGFTFYYMRRSKKGNTAIDGDAKTSLTDKASFTDAVKPIGTCRTVEEFWSI